MEATTGLERETISEWTSAVPERRTPALGLMASGLALVALAIALLVTHGGSGHRAPRPLATRPATPPAAAPEGLTIQSPGDISVLNMTYEQGQSSGWHAHRGIHAVAVISGQITVYDASCQAHSYGPGEAYIGGQQLHLVRNEGAEPAAMVVTYVNPISAGPAQVAPVPPAPPCGLS